MNYLVDSLGDKGREQSLTPVLVVLVSAAVRVQPDKSGHSMLYTQQTPLYHSGPEK